MAKKINGYINLQVPAGQANPSPPIGPALGQRGVNIMEFCKAFNAKSKDTEQGTPIPVTITVYSDRSFSFVMRTPPASFFLKKAAKLGSGSKEPGRTMVGKVTMPTQESSRFVATDVDGDGVISPADVILMVDRLLGKIATFPVEG